MPCRLFGRYDFKKKPANNAEMSKGDISAEYDEDDSDKSVQEDRDGSEDNDAVEEILDKVRIVLPEVRA